MTGWTDERTETAKALYASGHSASQIAAKLRGVTRNAVIGKLHRLGAIKPERAATSRDTAQLQSRLSAGQVAPTRKLTRAEANPLGPNGAARIKAAVTAAIQGDPRPIRTVETMSRMLPLAVLSERMCRYIPGDAVPENGSPALFCAATTEPDKVYCPAHQSLTRQEFKKGSTPKDFERGLRRHVGR